MRHDNHGKSDYDPIPDTGKLYETRDVALSALLKWITFLFIFVGGTAVVTFVIYKIFVPNGEESSQFPLARVRQLPPGPRLQANPVQDIKDYREAEITALTTYGRDPRTGAIHIPIERAMALVLADLPTRPGAGTIDYSKTTAPNTPSQFDGQAPPGQPGPPAGNNGMPNANAPGMQSDQGTMPTTAPPGTSTPTIPGGNNATSGGEPYSPTPGPVLGPSGNGQ